MWLLHEKINEASRLQREREIGRLLAVRRARRELRAARKADAEARRAAAAALREEERSRRERHVLGGSPARSRARGFGAQRSAKADIGRQPPARARAGQERGDDEPACTPQR